MSFRDGLLRARSHLVFIAGLLTAMAIIAAVDRTALQPLASPVETTAAGEADALIRAPRSLQLASPKALAPDQKAWGDIAWRYFENNINPDTGLANSTDRFPSTTMWDTASYLLALIAAERLGIIERPRFDAQTSLLLQSLARLPLFDGRLPNKAYDTRTLAMVDYDNQPTDRGLGWSALDMSRLLVALVTLRSGYPDHASAVEALLALWDLPALAAGGSMEGAVIDDAGKIVLKQEGRLGYEQYAARGILLAGLDVLSAADATAHVAFADVETIRIPYDDRPQSAFGAPVYATSEPYVLTGMEFGFDTALGAYAQQVYLAQAARFAATGTLTAVSEGHLDRLPYFAYSTVYGNGEPWAVLSSKGEKLDGDRTLSTKTAFAWDSLYATDYTSRLVEAVLPLNDPVRGWFEGRYESGPVNGVVTANTNAIILEALHFRAFGPLMLFNASTFR